MGQQHVVLFSHIPKTAGTSLKEGLILPHVAGKEVVRYTGLRELVRRNWSECRFVTGHYPFGIHKYMRGALSPRYLTVLREPLERQISYYYFVLNTRTATYTHPAWKDASETDIVGFFRRRQYQNVQTRFVAGIEWFAATRWTSTETLDDLMLSSAKRHLALRYAAFGLKERYRDTARLFSHVLDREYVAVGSRLKKTPGRVDAESLSDQQRSDLTELNRLDFELYEYARIEFDTALKSAALGSIDQVEPGSRRMTQ